MLILDVTVVAVALPSISADLGLWRQALTWVVSGYTLAFGGLLLLGGRAADLFGARRLMAIGLGLFTGASLLAGLAPTGWAPLSRTNGDLKGWGGRPGRPIRNYGSGGWGFESLAARQTRSSEPTKQEKLDGPVSGSVSP